MFVGDSSFEELKNSPLPLYSTWARFTFDRNHHADKIKKACYSRLSGKKRFLLRSALVRRYGAEKLGRSGKEAGKAGKTR